LEAILRALADVSPQTVWVLMFFAAVVAVFVLYVSIAMVYTLRADDEQQRKGRYQVFRDLLDALIGALGRGGRK
jgi:hypothetical protein